MVDTTGGATVVSVWYDTTVLVTIDCWTCVVTEPGSWLVFVSGAGQLCGVGPTVLIDVIGGRVCTLVVVDAGKGTALRVSVLYETTVEVTTDCWTAV